MRFFARIISMILGVTAFLKMWMLVSDPFADLTAQLPIAVLWLSVYVEFLVLYLMLSKLPIQTKWAIALVLFSSYWLFAFVRMTLGYTSCGCSGGFSIPPWASLVFNSLVLLFLVSVRPNPEEKRYLSVRDFFNWRDCSQLLLGTKQVSFVVAVLCVLVVFALFISTGTNDLYAEEIDLGEVTLGDSVVFECLIKNASNQDARLLGCRSSCSCLVSIEKLETIPKHGSHSRTCEFKGKKEGRINQKLLFYTDNPRQGAVYVSIKGVVIPNISN